MLSGKARPSVDEFGELAPASDPIRGSRFAVIATQVIGSPSRKEASRRRCANRARGREKELGSPHSHLTFSAKKSWEPRIGGGNEIHHPRLALRRETDAVCHSYTGMDIISKNAPQRGGPRLGGEQPGTTRDRGRVTTSLRNLPGRGMQSELISSSFTGSNRQSIHFIAHTETTNASRANADDRAPVDIGTPARTARDR